MSQPSRAVRHVRPAQVVLALCAAAVCLLAGCSNADELSAEQRAEAQALVIERSSEASIELSDDDRSCVLDKMTPTALAGLRSDQAGPTAEAVVSCVGDELIGASLLRSQAGEISEASLDCAVAELDRRFLVDLVAGAMNGAQPQVQAEIEVARVLSLCLDLDELL